jgi:hypothetical protein
MYEYVLMVKIPFESGDDPDARKKAKEVLKDMKVPEGSNIKLQRLEAGKAPVGIVLI